MWRWLVMACLAAGVARAADEVPWTTMREFELAAVPGKPLLVVEAWFRDSERRNCRRVALAVNGRLLTPDELLSPKQYYQLRYPRWEFDRMREKDFAIAFRRGANRAQLDEFDYREAREYDKWVPLYNNLPDTVCFDLRPIAPDAAGKYVVQIYNNAEGPDNKAEDGTPVGPPLVVERCEMVASPPPGDVYGLYVPPGWKALNDSAEQRARAQAKLVNPDTPPVLRAQLLAQIGLLKQMHGDPREAVSYWQQALETSRDIAAYPELCVRLAALGADPQAAPLAEGDTNMGRWAALYNALSRVRNGQPEPRLLEVPRHTAAFVVDGRADDAVWTDGAVAWRPIPYIIKGEPPAGMRGNEYKLFATPEGLGLIVRGPGAETLEIEDVPGRARSVWNYNCVELFVGTGTDFHWYWELNHSAGNGRWDGRYRWGGDVNPDWDGAWRSQARTVDGIWQVEYLVPWTDFDRQTPPAPGELWMGNIIRIQHVPGPDGKPVDVEYATVPLLWRHFHRLQEGLILKF